MPQQDQTPDVSSPLGESLALERARREAEAVCLSLRSSPPEQRVAMEFERRIRIVLATKRGASVRTIAEGLGCAKSLVSGVLRMYEAGGRTPDALRPRRRGRKPSPARTSQVRGILAKLYAEFGTTIPPIKYREKLNRTLAEPLHLSTVRRHLRALGARFRKSGK